MTEALVQLEDVCEGLGRNVACYGNTDVTTEFNVDVEPEFFTNPGETANLFEVDNIETSALNIEERLWGIALMNVQANLPGTLPGQSVVMMLLGDTYVENDVPAEDVFASDAILTVETSRPVSITVDPDESSAMITRVGAGTELLADALAENGAVRVTSGEVFGWVPQNAIANPRALTVLPTFGDGSQTPMQAFFFSTGIGNSRCSETPDSLIVQGPEQLTVDIRANGADISIGSTIALLTDETQTPAEMIVIVLEDEATITCEDGTQITIPAGFGTMATLSDLTDVGVNSFIDNRLVNCDWAEPEPVPVELLLPIAGPAFDLSTDVLNYELFIEDLIPPTPVATPTFTPIAPGGLPFLPVFTPTFTPVPPTPTLTPVPPSTGGDGGGGSNPEADVEVVLTTSVTSVNEGGDVDFTIIVTNNDTSDTAENVSVVVNVPSLPFSESAPPIAEQGAYDNVAGGWDIGDVAPGSSVTLSIFTTADVGSAGSTYTATANVSSDNDSDSGNNSDSKDVEVTTDPLADVTINAFFDTNPVFENGTLTFTIEVTNNDLGNTADTVAVTTNIETLPFTDSMAPNASVGGYDAGTGVWTVGSLAPGTTESLVFETTVDAGAGNATYNGTADVTSANDSNTLNNSASDATDVFALVDLSLDVVPSEPNPAEGDPVTFTFTVTNPDPSNAGENVEVVTDLPVQPFTVNGVPMASQGTYDSTTGVWDIGTLAAGDTVTLTVATTADSGSGGASYNIFSEALATNEANTTDNSRLVGVTVDVAQADVQVQISADFTTVDENDGVIFTITVTNLSTTTIADMVSMTTNLPMEPFTESTIPMASTGSYDSVSGFWDIGNMAPNAAETLVIETTADGGSGGMTYGIAADIASNNDNNVANDTDTVDIIVNPAIFADVTVNISADDANPIEGGGVTFTLEVVNNDAVNSATDVVVTTNLPSQPFTIFIPPVGTYNETTGEWTVGTLPPGNLVIFLNTLSDTGSGGSSYTVTADVTSSNDADPLNNTDSVLITVDPPVTTTDVALDLMAGNLFPIEGGFFSVTLNVQNNGGNTATNVVVTDNLTALGFTFSSVVISTTGTYDETTGEWTIGNLPLLGVEAIEIEYQAGAGTGSFAGTDYLVSAVATLDNEANTTDNTDSETINVSIPSLDIGVTVAANPTTINAGDPIQFTVTVDTPLSGPNAEAVQVQVPLPAAFTFDSSVPVPGTYDSVTGLWDVGTVTAGTAPILTINATANTNAGGSMPSIVADVTSTNDPNNGNNSDSEMVTINTPSADLAVSLTFTPSDDGPGGQTQVTMSVTNNGPDTALDVVAGDDLHAFPAIFVDPGALVPPQGTYDYPTGEWNIGDINSGATVTFTFMLDVQGSATIGDSANVTHDIRSSASTDPNSGNDSVMEFFGVSG